MRGDLGRLPAVRSLLALASCGAMALSCSQSSDPVALPVPRPDEQSDLFVEQVPISHDELGPGATAPAEAEASASIHVATALAPEDSVPPPARAPRARATTSQSAATTPPPVESHVPLEVLLRTPLEPGPPKNPLVLGEPGEAPVAAAPPAGEGWKDRVRIERHTEPYGVPGPKQGAVSQTEASVRIPVDDSISLNGGVRVDQRDEPGAAERVSRPEVGVEIKF